MNEKLLNIIKNYITAGTEHFPSFYKEYEELYMNDSFNKEFENVSEEDNVFFANVWDKAEWTIENPQEQDLKDGYLSYNSFYEWLEKEYVSKNLDKKSNKIRFKFTFIPLIIIVITLLVYAFLPTGADLISPEGDKLLGSITFHITWVAIVIDIIRYFSKKK